MTDDETTAPPITKVIWVQIPAELHYRLRQIAATAGDAQATAAAAIDALIRSQQTPELGGTDGTVEIGGQVMTVAQFNAARHPLLQTEPGPIDTELPTVDASADIESEPDDVDWPIVAFLRSGAADATANAALAQPERQSNLVDHARRELAIIGEDEWTTEGVVKIIRAFADMGHSGGSAYAVTEYLERLLRFQPLTDITDDPEDWIHHGEDVWGEPGGIWQCRRNGEAFSRDGGKTYYLVGERAADDPDLEVTPMHTSKQHDHAAD